MMNRNSTVPSWSIPLLLQPRRERQVYSTRYAKTDLVTTIILFFRGRKENSIFVLVGSIRFSLFYLFRPNYFTTNLRAKNIHNKQTNRLNQSSHHWKNVES
jgi:hypothetical protein